MRGLRDPLKIMDSFLEIYNMIGDLFTFYKEMEFKALHPESSDDNKMANYTNVL